MMSVSRANVCQIYNEGKGGEFAVVLKNCPVPVHKIALTENGRLARFCCYFVVLGKLGGKERPRFVARRPAFLTKRREHTTKLRARATELQAKKRAMYGRARWVLSC